MRFLFKLSMPVMLWVFVVVHALFLFLTIRKYLKTKNMLFLLTALVTVGLFYDALIISFGEFMQESSLLKGLSQFRFISHGALIPLLFPICIYAIDRKNTMLLAKKIVWGVTALISVMGIAEGFATVLESRTVELIVRYASSDLTPAWASKVSSLLSYGTVVPLIAVGVYVWVKQKTPYLFLSGFLMFAFSALGPATGNFDLIFFISMFGEAFMILFLYLYALKTEKK
ncbi:MAG: hypothetical protein MJ113_02815 [Lachnospiraceae bacterium]|nr:hypothetical protein [Lachnospiraceae bacterium]